MTSPSNQPELPRVSFYRNYNEPGKDIAIEEIFLKIKQGDYSEAIDKIRAYEKSGDIEKKDELKRKLPAFTPSATFSGGRKLELLQTYSRIVHLDFDKVPLDQYDQITKQVAGMLLTFACFRSPSGNGIKVFVKVSSGVELHTEVYGQVLMHYESILGIKADPKCKDITRLCFMSYDPDIFINPDSEVFKSTISKIEPKIGGVKRERASLPSDFESCVLFTEKKEQFTKGNRNNFIFQLASNCNRVGIPEAEVIVRICNRYGDLPVSELKAAVQSAYLNHVAEFASSANFAELQNEISEIDEIDYLLQSPHIPSKVFQNLPELLAKGCNVFEGFREKDVLLTGALVVLSGCLPGVFGVSAKQTVYPNLFCFIIAPAASGKGALKFAKMLGDKIHKDKLASSQMEQEAFLIRLEQFRDRQRSRKQNGTIITGPPAQPPMKVLFMPANTSFAKMIYHLSQNGGYGILCETEADTLVNALKQEWGSYSDLIRKAFHHERVSSSKKTNNEYIEINEPRLSVALSGTPSQVIGLIPSSEDGSFSRYMFYAFSAKPEWMDVSPGVDGLNLNNYFEQLSLTVAELFDFQNNYPTMFDLSNEQWSRLNLTCEGWLLQTTLFNGAESSSIVKRLGLIMFRIAMILTIVRKFETMDESPNVICSDTDFETALQLSQVYLDHSLYLFNNLPRHQKSALSRGGNNKQKFYEDLPALFKRTYAVELGKKHGMSVRTVDALLKKLLGTYLKQEAFGMYSKISISSNH